LNKDIAEQFPPKLKQTWEVYIKICKKILDISQNKITLLYVGETRPPAKSIQNNESDKYFDLDMINKDVYYITFVNIVTPSSVFFWGLVRGRR